jgi:hypothetical protein
VSSLKPNEIILNSEMYVIRPIPLIRALKLTNLIRTYVAKGSSVIKIATNQEIEALARFVQVMAMVNELVPDDVFEQDFVQFVYYLTGIPIEALQDVSTEELVDAMPAILEGSRFQAILSKLFSQVASTGVAQGLNGVNTDATLETAEIVVKAKAK